MSNTNRILLPLLLCVGHDASADGCKLVTPGRQSQDGYKAFTKVVWPIRGDLPWQRLAGQVKHIHFAPPDGVLFSGPAVAVPRLGGLAYAYFRLSQRPCGRGSQYLAE